LNDYQQNGGKALWEKGGIKMTPFSFGYKFGADLSLASGIGPDAYACQMTA